jgi:hypothetical protein
MQCLILHGRKVSFAQNSVAIQKPLELFLTLDRVAHMERLRGVFIVVLMVCWLMLVGQSGSGFSFDSQSAADIAQSSAPADNDDHSDDGTSADDFTIQSRRIELAVSLQALLTPARPVFNPPVNRQTASFIPPNLWQFIEGAGAAPRAPTFRA